MLRTAGVHAPSVQWLHRSQCIIQAPQCATSMAARTRSLCPDAVTAAAGSLTAPVEAVVHTQAHRIHVRVETRVAP